MQIVSVSSKRDQIRKREVMQELLDDMEIGLLCGVHAGVAEPFRDARY